VTVWPAACTYGRLDAAFNNAGINTDNAPLLETPDDEFEQVIRPGAVRA
jgi:NAD(P)-dependent dehydrogenase (short-subunit alcohol dehydrogenase family)